MESQGLLVAQMSGGYLTSPKQKRKCWSYANKKRKSKPPNNPVETIRSLFGGNTWRIIPVSKLIPIYQTI